MTQKFRLKATIAAISGQAVNVEKVAVTAYIKRGQILGTDDGTSIVPDPVEGAVINGVLKGTDGADGLLLYSDTEDLNLGAPLAYRIDFRNATAGSKRLLISQIIVPARADTADLILGSATPIAETPESVTIPGFLINGVDLVDGRVQFSANGQAVGNPLDLTISGNATGLGSVADAAGEWWIAPMAMYQSTPYPRTVFGAIGADGMILACERNHSTGVTKRVELELAPPDDHNVPAIWAMDGHRPLIMWTYHGGALGPVNNVMLARVGDKSGRVDSLANAPTQVLSGAGYSYTQIVHRRAASTSTNDEFWVFTRSSIGQWRIVPVTVNQTTGAITWGTTIPVFRSYLPDNTTPHTMYAAVVDEYAELVNPAADQKLRVGCIHNPAENGGDGFDHAVWYFEINVATGAVTCPDHPALSANILTATNLPINLPATTPRIPETGPTSRRLFGVRPGPDLPALALAEWDPPGYDAASYRVHECINRATQAHNGLIPGSGGYAGAPATTAMNALTNGVIIESEFRLPAAAEQVDVCRRYGTGNNLFYVRVLNTGAIQVYVGTDVGGGSVTTGTALSAQWGNRIKVRVAINPTTGSYSFGAGVGSVAAKTVAVAWSSNGGSSWTTLTALTLTGTPTAMLQTTAPLLVPATVGTGMQVFYSAKLMNRDGGTVAVADFETVWPSGALAYNDPQGNAWSVTAPAAVGRTTPAWTDRAYGASGPRFGYNQEANYLPGLGFDSPSHSRRLFKTSSDGVAEVLTRYDRKLDGTDAVTTLVSRSAAGGRIARPYPPISPAGTPPYDTLYNWITEYDHYTEYLMSSEAAPVERSSLTSGGALGTGGGSSGGEAGPTALTDLDTTVTGAQLDALKTKVDGIETGADVTDTGNVAAAIHGAATKSTPASGDELAVVDSAFALRRTTFSDLATAIIALIVDAAPGTLDTLNELAAAIGDDPNFAATIATALAGKQALHANLTALAGLTGAANKVAFFTAAGAMALGDLTGFARNVISQTDDPGVRSVIKAAPAAIPIASTKTAAYTFAAADINGLVPGNSASNLNFTVPPNSTVSIPVGSQIGGAQLGAGTITFVAGSGVTLLPQPGGSLVTRGQNAIMWALKIATDTWLVGGDTQ